MTLFLRVGGILMKLGTVIQHVTDLMVGSCMALFYIQQMLQVNSYNHFLMMTACMWSGCLLMLIVLIFLTNKKANQLNYKRANVVVDYVNGGEMFTHLYQREHFTEPEVRIYIAEIVLALERLHSVRIVSLI